MPQARQEFRILILAALPQEYSPLKRLIPSWRRIQRRPFAKFAVNLPGKEVILAECGMGPKSAGKVLEAELASFNPDLVIFSGFAGGLHPDLKVGIVCFVTSAGRVNADAVFDFSVPDAIAHFLAQNHIRPVLAISATAPGDKRALSALACGQPAVLDMETSMIAEAALHHGIPFICFRAVSDAVGDELGFNLGAITDGRGRVRLAGVLAAVIRKPSTVKAFYLSWRRSRLAAGNLCRSIDAFLKVPVPVLGRLTCEIRIERRTRCF
jgi:adenosylhomocysteine nucleosidase